MHKTEKSLEMFWAANIVNISSEYTGHHENDSRTNHRTNSLYVWLDLEFNSLMSHLTRIAYIHSIYPRNIHCILPMQDYMAPLLHFFLSFYIFRLVKNLVVAGNYDMEMFLLFVTFVS